jgi:hypothetical protein
LKIYQIYLNLANYKLVVSQQSAGGYSTCEKCKMKIFRIKLCFQESIVQTCLVKNWSDIRT